VHPNPFGLALSQSPVDLPEPLIPPPPPLRWTSTVIAVAALVLALLNAHAIRDWAYQLPPGDWSERAVTAAERWYDAVGAFGLNRPVETMHGGWEAQRMRRFGPQTGSPGASQAEAQ
jgi:hypothetical protein